MPQDDIVFRAMSRKAEKDRKRAEARGGWYPITGWPDASPTSEGLQRRMNYARARIPFDTPYEVRLDEGERINARKRTREMNEAMERKATEAMRSESRWRNRKARKPKAAAQADALKE